MNASDLDAVYTHLCETMSRLGEAAAPLYLARLSLLALTNIGDRRVADDLIESAADGMATGTPSNPG